jgi:hypothetical protein
MLFEQVVLVNGSAAVQPVGKAETHKKTRTTFKRETPGFEPLGLF